MGQPALKNENQKYNIENSQLAKQQQNIQNENNDNQKTEAELVLEQSLQQQLAAKQQQLQTSSQVVETTTPELNPKQTKSLYDTYKGVKFGLDPYTYASKVNPFLGMVASEVYTNTILRPAKYGFMDKSPVANAVSSLTGITSDTLQTAVLSHYFIRKSPEILKNIHEREKSNLLMKKGGQSNFLIENAYQANRILYDLMKLTYLPSMMLGGAGLALKSLPFLSSGLGSLLPGGSLLSLALSPVTGLSSLLGSGLLGLSSTVGGLLNPFNTIFPLLGHLTGTAALGKSIAASGLLGPLGALFASPAMMGMLAYTGINLGIGIARSISMRKFRPKNVNAYELETQTSASSQMQPILTQIVSTNKNVDPIQVLQLQVLMAIEQHTSIIPLLYNLLHSTNEQKRTDIDYSSDIEYSALVDKHSTRWYEKPQKFLESIRARFDPFSIIMNYITTGKAPKDFIKDIIYGREKETKQKELLSSKLGVSYQTVSLLTTSGKEIVGSAKTYEGKVINLLTGIYDVLRAQLGELIAIRKGFGFSHSKELIDVFKFKDQEFKSVIQGLFTNVLFKIPGATKTLITNREAIKEKTKSVLPIIHRIKESEKVKTAADYTKQLYENRNNILDKIKTFDLTTTLNTIRDKAKTFDYKSLFTKIDKDKLKEETKEKILNFNVDKAIEKAKELIDYTNKNFLNIDLVDEQLKTQIKQIETQEKQENILYKIYEVLTKIYETIKSSVKINKQTNETITVDSDKIISSDKTRIIPISSENKLVKQAPEREYKTLRDYIRLSKDKVNDIRTKVASIKEQKQVQQALQIAKNRLPEPVKSEAEKVISVAPIYYDVVKTAVSNTIGRIISNLPKFEKGGEVKGKDEGKDSVLALLRPGEYVLSHDTLKELGKYFITIISNITSTVKTKTSEVKSTNLYQKLLQKKEELKEKKEELFRKYSLTTLTDIDKQLSKLVKFITNIKTEKKDDDDPLQLLLGTLTGAYAFGKKALGKLVDFVGGKIIRPIINTVVTKVLPESFVNAGKSVFSSLSGNFLTGIIGKLSSKFLGFGIGSGIAEYFFGSGDLTKSISAGVGGFAGALAGSAIMPGIGTFLGSILGAEVGKFIIPKLLSFFTESFDTIKNIGEKSITFVVSGIKDIATDVTNILDETGILKPFKILYKAGEKVLSVIKEVLSAPIDFIKNIIDKIIELIKNIKDLVKDKLGTALKFAAKYIPGFGFIAEKIYEIIDSPDETSAQVTSSTQQSNTNIVNVSSANTQQANTATINQQSDLTTINHQTNPPIISKVKDKTNEIYNKVSSNNNVQQVVTGITSSTKTVIDKIVPQETKEYIKNEFIPTMSDATQSIYDSTIKYLKNIKEKALEKYDEYKNEMAATEKSTTQEQTTDTTQTQLTDMLGGIINPNNQNDAIKVVDTKTLAFIHQLLDTNLLTLEEYLYLNIIDNRA